MYKPRIAASPQQLTRSICRMVIHNDDVEVKAGLLSKHALNGIENRSLTIFYRNHDTVAPQELLVRCRHGLKARLEPGADAFEMLRRDGFHFNLVIAILWIDVVELLLPGRPRVGDRCGIKRLGHAHDGTLLRNA